MPIFSFIAILSVYLVWTAAASWVGIWAHKRIDALKKENEELRARMDKLEQSHPFNFMRRAN